MPALLLLNDTSEVPNWGTQATMDALRKMLHERIPGLELVTITQEALLRDYASFGLPLGRRAYLDPGSSLLGQLPVLRDSVERRAKAQASRLFPLHANGLEATGRRWDRAGGHPYVQGFMRAAESADCVVHNGELLNFTRTEVSARGMFLAWLAKCRLGKRAAVINQTTPSEGQDPVMSGLLQAVCEKMDVVTVREPHSLRAMQVLGVPARLVPDPTFWLSEDSFDAAEAREWRSRVGLSQPYFCLSLSSGLPVQGSAEVLLPLIERLQLLAPGAVLLAYGGGNRLLQMVAAKAKDCFVYAGGFRGVAPLLREAAFSVTGHYHNIILGAMVGCPFVPLAGLSHKVQGLLELLDWPYPEVFNPTALKHVLAGIVDAANRVAQDRASLSEHLLRQSSALRDRSGETGYLLQGLMARA